MKQCIDCGELKELTDFHRKQDNADGYKNFCRNCSAKRLRNWRNANKDKHKQHDATYNLKYPKKRIAKNIVNKAIMSGCLERKPCETCGKSKAQAHHPDYDFPMKIIWLCPIHHSKVHQEQK